MHCHSNFTIFRKPSWPPGRAQCWPGLSLYPVIPCPVFAMLGHPCWQESLPQKTASPGGPGAGLIRLRAPQPSTTEVMKKQAAPHHFPPSGRGSNTHTHTHPHVHAHIQLYSPCIHTNARSHIHTQMYANRCLHNTPHSSHTHTLSYKHTCTIT